MSGKRADFLDAESTRRKHYTYTYFHAQSRGSMQIWPFGRRDGANRRRNSHITSLESPRYAAARNAVKRVSILRKSLPWMLDGADGEKRATRRSVCEFT